MINKQVFSHYNYEAIYKSRLLLDQKTIFLRFPGVENEMSGGDKGCLRDYSRYRKITVWTIQMSRGLRSPSGGKVAISGGSRKICLSGVKKYMSGGISTCPGHIC